MYVVNFRLVYCLLGRCDLADAHTDVAQSIDDFLWLRLSQIAFTKDGGDTSEDGENLTLGQLQTLLYETYGEPRVRHYQCMYYQSLLLTCASFVPRRGSLRRRQPAPHILQGSLYEPAV